MRYRTQCGRDVVDMGCKRSQMRSAVRGICCNRAWVSPGLRFYEIVPFAHSARPGRPQLLSPALGPFLWAQPRMKKPQALAHCGSPGSKIERL